MPKKPSNLIYGLEDKPPLLITIILGFQHSCLFFVLMTLPIIIIRQLGNSITPEEAQSYLSMTMIAGGITVMLQSYRRFGIGSGYFCPGLCGPAYMDATQMAAALGGLPLVFGMTMLSGAIESLFSKVMNKLRFLFPAEITGLIVSMVGLSLLPVSLEYFFGTQQKTAGSNFAAISIGFLTLAVMVGLNIWSKGNMKLFCALIGVILGYFASILTGIIPPGDLHRIVAARFIHFPMIRHIRWTFDFTMIVPFIIAAICSTFKTVGDIVTCQKINDPDWKRADMKTLSGGIFADGLGGVIPGLIGGFGLSTSSSNVGLSIATGATSRVISLAMGGILIFMAFFPKLSEVMIIMPAPVMGAALIFAVSFIILTGFQIMVSRMMNARRIFVIGISLAFGLCVYFIPGAYSGVHPWLKPVFSSALSVTTIMALILNLIFRIGVAEKARLELNPAAFSSSDILDFMERQGGNWGARPDVIHSAAGAMNETMETIISNKLSSSNVLMLVSFNEFDLNIDICYSGDPIEFPDRKPSRQEMIEDDHATTMLSGYMIRQYVDGLKTEQKGEQMNIKFHFKH
ncbi:MAG: solute carrier family 23 protein [Bacteroidales bacterium]|jgi:NCS2 family nucleobase:cation symporter-2